MKIWFISDTHNRHAELDVPNVDLVIHCGDEASVWKSWLNQIQSEAFFNWFEGLDIETKVFVPGNHSTAVAEGLVKPEDYPSIQFLVHEGVIWHGLRIFGSPYTLMFFDWAYMKMQDDLNAIWATIPEDTDILVTHGPPKGILDVTRDWRTKEPIHIGSLSLTRHFENRIRPKIHAFGHLHDEPAIRNFGTLTRGVTQFINCSCCDLAGNLVNQGSVIEVEMDAHRRPNACQS